MNFIVQTIVNVNQLILLIGLTKPESYRTVFGKTLDRLRAKVLGHSLALTQVETGAADEPGFGMLQNLERQLLTIVGKQLGEPETLRSVLMGQMSPSLSRKFKVDVNELIVGVLTSMKPPAPVFIENEGTVASLFVSYVRNADWHALLMTLSKFSEAAWTLDETSQVASLLKDKFSSPQGRARNAEVGKKLFEKIAGKPTRTFNLQRAISLQLTLDPAVLAYHPRILRVIEHPHCSGSDLTDLWAPLANRQVVLAGDSTSDVLKRADEWLMEVVKNADKLYRKLIRAGAAIERNKANQIKLETQEHLKALPAHVLAALKNNPALLNQL